MTMFEKYYRISGIIAAKIAGTITVSEQEELDEWLQENEQHEEIFRDISRRLKDGEEAKSYRYAPAVRADWERVKRQLGYENTGKRIIGRVWRYAAMVVLLIGLSLAYWQIQIKTDDLVVVTASKQEPIRAGSSKAVLTFASGEKMALEESVMDSILVDGVVVERSAGGLSYQQSAEKNEHGEEIYNMINVPNGGEYRLTLADGTRVWINSASELKYPVKFVGKTRTIYIKGEAYFEVAKDAHRPFIVRTTDNLEVRVLGTHFNVSAYEEDDFISTTLAEGRVEVFNGKQTIDLMPDQQAVFEKKSEHFTCRQVDALAYVAWREGKFVFENETLENIMERLRRWYNIEVFFKEERSRTLRFSGDLDRYNDFSTALRMMERVSRIKIEIKDKNVFIEER